MATIYMGSSRAGQTFKTCDGTTYTADDNGYIDVPSRSDALDLIAAGGSRLPEGATGPADIVGTDTA
jgi:hypothetical protein